MKDLILSVELASDVLGLNVAYIESCEHRDNIIGIWTDMSMKPIKEINIYEFAFKCKEWANKQNYDNNCFVSILYENGTSKTMITEDGFGLNGNTEIEAIIKTCEWLLEQQKCQN